MDDMTTKIVAHDVRIEALDNRLDKIEGKIDRILEVMATGEDSISARTALHEDRIKRIEDSLDDVEKFRLDIWKAALISIATAVATKIAGLGGLK